MNRKKFLQNSISVIAGIFALPLIIKKSEKPRRKPSYVKADELRKWSNNDYSTFTVGDLDRCLESEEWTKVINKQGGLNLYISGDGINWKKI
jgi:hypothetical protein